MEVKSVGEVKIAVIPARVDANSAKDVETKLNEIVGGGARKLVCDFSGNDYISSAGLRVFLSMLKQMQKNGGKIVLCQMKPYVREVFDMAGFSQLFQIYTTENDAVTNV
ncbi:MAG TPA: STAS domain-containing protein [Patescibacteria group bacterium]|nr:STAS domain-containing protein [Patescibacteria group bacterium]